MLRCKAREVMRNEAYSLYVAMTNDERNAADGVLQLQIAITRNCKRSYDTC